MLKRCSNCRYCIIDLKALYCGVFIQKCALMQHNIIHPSYDGHCKSYEGTFEWTVCYPNYFEDETGDNGASFYKLTLHCYVLGLARHYDWTGKTMDEALDKAEAEIDSWIGGEEDGKQEH